MFDAVESARQIVIDKAKTQHKPTLIFAGSRAPGSFEGRIFKYWLTQDASQVEFLLLDEQGKLIEQIFCVTGRLASIILVARRDYVFRLYCEVSSITGIGYVKDIELLP